MKISATECIPIKPSKAAKKWPEGQISWTRSPGFAANTRGVLTHRVVHVTTIMRGAERSHYHVNYLCGNGCNVDVEAITDTLVSDPPEDRLLCERCEDVARRKELPSGDQLAGRHVHRGVLVPKQTCCNHDQTEGSP